jgi:histidyl-tRNA synthetase
MLTDITVALDKLEKIGSDAVIRELEMKGVSTQSILKLEPVFSISGTNEVKLASLKKLFRDSETGLKGIEEMEYLLNCMRPTSLKSEIELDISLARGLHYYTGTIIEVKAMDAEIGSICGGGRYDDLTGIFGLKNISGVGISFGADRIYDVMAHLNLFPQDTAVSSSIMFVNFGEKESLYCFALLAKLHEAGIAAELYPDSSKLNKQLSYANARHIPYVVMAGENEIKEGKLTVKDMTTGEQHTVIPSELAGWINNF